MRRHLVSARRRRHAAWLGGGNESKWRGARPQLKRGWPRRISVGVKLGVIAAAVLLSYHQSAAVALCNIWRNIILAVAYQ
jgi:hypothetical protein